MKVKASDYVYEGKTGTHYRFFCPGCDQAHVINHTWQYNNNPESATFSPSILVTWKGLEDGLPKEKRCHSFIRDGKIEFLTDCTHFMAGQTVELPEWPYGG